MRTLSARQNIMKRASRRGALFVACLFFISPSLAEQCPAERIQENVTVEKVVDGDTLKLADGRLVRFIGVNTPEMSRRGQPAEPFAKQAKEAVELLLKDSGQARGMSVGLQYDAERKDRHGRTLAHVYLPNGRSVQADLLTRGLAAQIVVPPNLANRSCYRDAETAAKQSGQGVWGSIFKSIPVQNLPRDSKGFRVISGRIINVGESRQSIWLNFPRHAGERKREGIAVRIARKDLAYFDQWQPQQLKNKKVIVRGWLYPYKKQRVMRVRHPSSIEIVAETWNKGRD